MPESPVALRRRFIEYALWSVAVAAALVGVRVWFGYPLFHAIAEVFAVVIGIGTFMIAWNARRYLTNGYILFLGIAFFFVACVDTLHALSYKGLQVFPGADDNLPTQLWLIGRYLQASAVLIAPRYARRMPRAGAVFGAYAAATAALLASVFVLDVFPTAWTEPGGLTAFKITSEWIVIGAFGVGMVGLWVHRRAFDQVVYWHLMGSIGASILAELAFMSYGDPFATPNMIGHLLRILAYFLFYRAIIETSITRPYDTLFRELSQTAAALRESETRFRSTFEQASLGIAHLGMDGRFSLVNEQMASMLGYTTEELLGMEPAELTHPDDSAAEQELLEGLVAGDIRDYRIEKRYVRPDGTTLWANVSRSIVYETDGTPSYFVTIAEDITSRKAAEERIAHAAALNEALNAIDRAINATLEIDEVMRRVTAAGTSVIGASTATVWIKEKDDWVPRLSHGYPQLIVNRRFNAEQVPHVEHAVRHGEPLMIEDAVQSEYFSVGDMPEHTVRSALVIPLALRGETYGALSFVWRDEMHQFTEEERDFARKLGSSLSLAIDNANLYAAERRIADTLQGYMLEMESDLPGVAIGTAYSSASELARIGGDFYDAFLLEDGRVAFVLGDVAGKGLDAAAVTVTAKNTLRSFAHEHADPPTVAREANKTLSMQAEEGRFVTVVFGVLDTDSGHVQIVIAGHPAPIACGATECIDHIVKRNPPLAVFEDFEFEPYELVLTPGDRLIAFSDGLLDARSGSDFLGEARVKDILEGLGDADPQETADALLEAARAHAGGSPGDDIAILALRYLGPA